MGGVLLSPLAGAASSSLPQPGASGRVQVGVCDVMTADGPDGDAGVLARLFYPTDMDLWESAAFIDDPGGLGCPEEEEDPLPPWIERREYIVALLGQLKTVSRRAHWLAEWVVGERRIRCRWQAPLASARTLPDPLPLIIFSHGLGSSRHLHSSLCSALASHGFVVAAIEHRDYTACWSYKLAEEAGNNSDEVIFGERPVTFMQVDDLKREHKIRSQQVQKRVSECVRLLHVLEELALGVVRPAGGLSAALAAPSRVLVGRHMDWSSFKNRLDLGRASIVGHGLGGATALAACAFSTDLQSAVVLDGALSALDSGVNDRVTQPVLFVAPTLRTKNTHFCDLLLSSGKPLPSKRPTHSSVISIMDGDQHAFSDVSLLLRPFLARRLRLAGTADPSLFAEAVVELVRSFLTKTSRSECPKTELDRVASDLFPGLLRASN